MSIFANEVITVFGTNIVSLSVGYHKSDDDPNVIHPGQLVVYSTQVETLVDNNALILPVYNVGNDVNNIIPLNTEEVISCAEKLTNFLALWYDPPEPSDRYFEDPDSYCTLPVYTVEDYEFTVVSHKSKFKDLDQISLKLHPTAEATINAHNDDYSFLVCKFNCKGRLKLLPFGYICPVKSCQNGCDRLIIPTVHGHPEMGVMDEYFGVTRLDETKDYKFHNKTVYDHVIYALTRAGPKYEEIEFYDLQCLDYVLKKINRDFLKRRILLYIPTRLLSYQIAHRKKGPNRNILIGPSGDEFIEDLVTQS